MSIKNIGIRAKLIIILLAFLTGTIITEYIFLNYSKEALIEELKTNAQKTVGMAKSEGDRLVGLYKKGELTKEQAKTRYLNTLKGLSFGAEYVFAYDSEGVRLANGKDTKTIGKNFYNIKDANGVLVIKSIIQNALAGSVKPVYYMWKKADTGKVAEKITYTAYVKDFDLVIGTGGYLDKINEVYHKEVKDVVAGTSIFLLIITVITMLLANTIVSPIKQVVKVINNMTNDDYNDVLDTDRKDEVGLINKGLDEFKTGLLSSKALEEQQRQMEKEQLEKAEFVGSTTKNVSNAVFEIEEHITGISSSASELSSTLQDIAKKVDDTSNMTALAEKEAEKGTTTIQNLNNISESIGDVVKLIQEIADKTNLLALNASIEAARAGEEGRGFAVVAEEVKKLAQQTRESTDSISAQIKKIQTGSSESVNAIENISHQIASINNFTQELVVSIEEQKEATNDISERMVQASDGSKFVAEKMKEIVSKV
ncbi:MAG: HAMP domain-containing protein [Proteobacteria bacterium]|nr:HAMP domain-containing protein [Pseudomonadota bacterium]